MGLLNKLRDVIKSNKNNTVSGSKPYRRTGYTQNAADFHQVRLGALEIVNPNSEEPMTVECIDGRKEQYFRDVHGLPLCSPGVALEKGMSVRMYIPHHGQVLQFAGVSKKVFEVIDERDPEKGYITKRSYKEIGVFELIRLEDGVFETPRGEKFASEQFTHAIQIDAEIVLKNGERKRQSALLPIYNGRHQTIATGRANYRRLIDVRRESSYEDCVNKKIPRPSIKSSDGWALRWNHLGQLGETRFKIKKVNNLSNVESDGLLS